MKKARREDGTVVLASQCENMAPGTLYVCADKFCNAAMRRRRESLTHGSQFVRSATFVSVDVKQHRAACSAHEQIKILARHKKSIDEALRRKGKVVINLNLRMADEFNDRSKYASSIGVASAPMLRNYASVPAKSIEDVLFYIQTIEDKAGAAGLAATYINHEGALTPLDKFIVKDRDAYRELLRSAFHMLENSPAEVATGSPRLIVFEKNAVKRFDEDDLTLRGSEMVYARNNGAQMFVRQKLDAAPEFADALDSGEKVYLIARPVMNYAEAKAVHDANYFGRSAAFDLHWKVVDAAQFTVIDETPKPVTTKKKKGNTP